MTLALWTLAWVLLAELAASFGGWRGLALLGRQRVWIAAALLLVAVLALVLLGATQWWHIVVGGVIGLLLFVALAAYAQRNLAATTILAPGARDGRRIAHVEVPIAGGPIPAVLVEPLHGAEFAVLVVHGAGDHKLLYAWPRMYTLSDHGFAVLAIDVDGHGASPRVLDFPSVLEDVAAGVAWLRERYHRVGVIGISQGGCIAARAVAEASTSLPGRPGGMQADRLRVDALVIMEAPAAINITRAVYRHEARILAYPVAWQLLRDIGTVGIYREWWTPAVRTRLSTVELIRRLDIVGSVRRITCPLLLVYGGRDAVVPMEQARAVEAAAPPGATFVLVPGATHLSLTIDRRVIRRVALWLREELRMENGELRKGGPPEATLNRCIGQAQRRTTNG